LSTAATSGKHGLLNLAHVSAAIGSLPDGVTRKNNWNADLDGNTPVGNVGYTHQLLPYARILTLR